MLKCCYYGYHTLYDYDLRQRFIDELEKIIAKDNEIEFWVFRIHDVEWMCLWQVAMLRSKYPNKSIKTVRILDPLKEIESQEMHNWYNEAVDMKLPSCFVDEMMYAPVLEGKSTEIKGLYVEQSNKIERWILSQCDYVFAYIYPNLPGSEHYQIRFAEKSSNTTVISLAFEDTIAFIDELIGQHEEPIRYAFESLNAGKSYKEIATAIGKTRGALEKKIQHDTRKLREQMTMRHRGQFRKDTEQTTKLKPRICLFAELGEPKAMKLLAFGGLLETMKYHFNISEYWFSEELYDGAFAAILANRTYHEHITRRVLTGKENMSDEEYHAAKGKIAPIFTELVCAADRTADTLLALCDKLGFDLAFIVTDLSAAKDGGAKYKEICAKSGTTTLLDFSKQRPEYQG